MLKAESLCFRAITQGDIYSVTTVRDVVDYQNAFRSQAPQNHFKSPSHVPPHIDTKPSISGSSPCCATLNSPNLIGSQAFCTLLTNASSRCSRLFSSGQRQRINPRAKPMKK